MRAAAALALAALVGGGWLWWQGQHWAPSRREFPIQGVLIGARDGAPDFAALRAVGARFAYLEASSGAGGRDPQFARNLQAAREAGFRYGVVHAYDACAAAERQAANFMTLVPRDRALLPPAVALSRTAETCQDRLSETAMESELTTFLNQIEGHVGQPAVLLLSPGFESHYHVATRLDRALWLTRDWLQPDYGGRPWTLWTANSARRTEASEAPLRWVVAQP
ncbi:MAG: glycoside hydrolase family 25 protein [Croceibacterium sp.]